MLLKRSGNAKAEMLVVAEDVGRFAGLGEELESEFPAGGWTAVTPRALRKALDGDAPPPNALFAADAEDAGRLGEIAELVSLCRGRGISVILVVQDLPTNDVHRLLRAGADDFLPVPVPRGDLADSLQRLAVRSAHKTAAAGAPSRNGVIYPVYGVAGGVGATVFAVNLAWELTHEARKTDLRICLLDLDFQYGSVATYLDLPRSAAVYELLSAIDRADAGALSGAMEEYGRRLSVLTAPADALPVDFLSSEAMTKLLTIAKDNYDIVVIDMPSALTSWTEVAINMSHRFWTVMEIDMRSAQNMLRFLRTVQADELPVEKLDYIVNRVPGFSDLGARGRVKKMAETLGIEYGILMPDGGKAVTQACDHGSPLAEFAGGNALRKEIRKAARAILDEVLAVKSAAM